ncbi:MAG: hypothetical protein ACXV2H_07170 [Actinomycetes bacterium]
MKCQRCDWKPDPDDPRPLTLKGQRYEHAAIADHPLCSVCTRSLPDTEPTVCEKCLTGARELLSGIVTMYFEDLPSHLGQPRGTGYDSDRPAAADGRPLPGGDVLVLLGPGSEGWSDDAETNRAGDATSVSFELGYWEQAWRDARRDPAPLSHRPDVVVRQAAKYLEVHARWAANTHPAFADFIRDIRALHQRLERATGRAERLIRAEAECFTCGADALVRRARSADQCEHGRPTEQLLHGPLREGVDRHQERAERLQAWAAEHARCEQGGFENHWTCERCGETYDWARYLLAVSSRLQESDVPGWGLPEQIAFVLGVNPKTVRGWGDRLQVRTACVVGGKPDEHDKRMRIWWEDARARALKLEEQRRARAAAQAQEVAS